MPIDDDPPDPFLGSLRYGYVAGTGRVAIDPNLVYTVCTETSTLIVHAGQEDTVAAALNAIRREDGSWLLPSGTAVVPQIATYAIVPPASVVSTAASELTPIGIDQVSLVMADLNLACTSAVKRWKCRDKNPDGTQYGCSGCFGRRKFEGPAKATTCRWTGDDKDQCEMNGQIVACKYTEYELDKCKGAIIKRGVKAIQQCDMDQ